MANKNSSRLLLMALLCIIYLSSSAQTNTDEVDTLPHMRGHIFGKTKATFALLKNAETPLKIPTPDSTSEAVHPSVIDFQKVKSSGTWCNYRFWMGYNPYANTNALAENPCIAASNDGKNWVVPVGFKFPLEGPPSTGNNCDIDIIYNPDVNEIWVYYMYRGNIIKDKDTIPGAIKLIRVREDGNSTEPVIVKFFKPHDKATIVSPSFWRESANKWHFWGVYLQHPNPIVHSFSSDGIHWQDETVCTNGEGVPALENSGYFAWHFSCKPNYFENRIEFMIAARENAIEKPYNVACIIYAQCNMATPDKIELPLKVPVLMNCLKYNPWDLKLYRPSFQMFRTDIGYFYRIWYSGCAYKNWHIGYTESLLPTPFNNAGEKQSLTFDSIPYKTTKDSIIEFDSIASSSLVVDYGCDNSLVAKIYGSKCFLTGKSGMARIVARQEGDSVFNAAEPIARWLIVLNDDQKNRYLELLDSVSAESKMFGITDYSDSVIYPQYSLLKKIYNNNYPVLWSTNNTKLLLSDGRVRRPNYLNNDTSIALKAKVQFEDDISIFKEYKVRVKAESRIETLQRLVDGMTITSMGIKPKQTTVNSLSNLKLAKTLGEGTRIIWVSNDTSKVNNQGVVSKKLITSAEVTFTAFVYIDTDTLCKSFSITVLPSKQTDISQTEQRFQIMPNPASSHIKISLNDHVLHHAKIVDLNGRLMYEKTFVKCISIDLSSFKPGTYIVNIDGIVKNFIKK